jgi:hypothetical protein
MFGALQIRPRWLRMKQSGEQGKWRAACREGFMSVFRDL